MGRVHRGRLAVATIGAVAVVLSSPFIGELRASIRAAFPTQFQAIVSGAVTIAVVVALIAAVVRVRDRRAWRFAVLAASIGGAALYARIVATGNPDVDVVESGPQQRRSKRSGQDQNAPQRDAECQGGGNGRNATPYPSPCTLSRQ